MVSHDGNTICKGSGIEGYIPFRYRSVGGEGKEFHISPIPRDYSPLSDYSPLVNDKISADGFRPKAEKSFPHK